KAEEAWRKALGTWELLTGKPDANINAVQSRHFRSRRAGTHFSLGALCLSAGRKEQALVECVKAIALREKLAEEDRRDVRSRTHRAYALSFASRAYEANGHNDQAVAAVDRAVAVWEKLAREKDGTFEQRAEAAGCHSRLGDLHGEAGRRAEAEAAYK